MPTLSSSNRSQLSVKLEGVYPEHFGVPQPGNGAALAMTSESLDYSVKTETSKSLRADRAVADVIAVSAGAQGGFGFELAFKEYDVFLQGVLQQDFEYWGQDGVSDLLGPLSLTASTITASVAPVGASAFTQLERGQWFGLRPVEGSPQAVLVYFASRSFRVSRVMLPTETVLTLDEATPLDLSRASEALQNAVMSSARVSNGSTMKSYTLEVAHTDIEVYRQFTGMIAAKLNLKLSVGAIVTGSVEFIGKGFKLAGASDMGQLVPSTGYSPANATRGVFDVFENHTPIAASTYIKSADLTIDNSLRAQDAVGVFGNAGVASGTFNVTASLELYFADRMLYEKFLNQEASSLSIPILDGAGNGYVFEMPRIKYTAAKVNAGGLDQDNLLKVELRALPELRPRSLHYGRTLVLYRIGV